MLIVLSLFIVRKNQFLRDSHEDDDVRSNRSQCAHSVFCGANCPFAARGKPKLAVIYPPIGSDYAAIVSAVKKVADVPVIGATTGGAGFTEKGIALNALVGGFISGDDVSVSTAVIKDLSKDQDESLKNMIGSLNTGSKGGQTLFMLADPFACDGEALS